MEGLAVAALGLIALHQGQQRSGDLVDRKGADDPVDEGGVGTERTPQADVDCLFDVFVDVRDVTAEANVGDLGLRTRG